MLEVENLQVRYGGIEALHGISFHVKKGEMVALLGANGAGKSTTLMSIMRLPPPEGPMVSGGRITFEGKDLLGVAAHAVVAKHGIGLVPEGRHIFGNLTVQEKPEACDLRAEGDPGTGKGLRAGVFALPGPGQKTPAEGGHPERRGASRCSPWGGRS